MYTVRGIARNLLRRNKTEGLGDGSPQRGPGAGPPVGVWGKYPRSWRHILNASFIGENKQKTQGKLTQLLTLLL